MILALDFDGLLHPMNAAAAGRFCRLPLLEAWLRNVYEVDIVISSSWRESHTLDELRSHFAEDLQQRVVGVTPLAHRLFGPAWSRTPEEGAKARYVRQAEIEAWRVESGRDSSLGSLSTTTRHSSSPSVRSLWSVSRTSDSPRSDSRRSITWRYLP